MLTTINAYYEDGSQQGIESLTDQEAEELVGKDRESHQKDLYESIENGAFPRWDFKIQTMPEQDAANYRFHPFDLTKKHKKNKRLFS